MYHALLWETEGRFSRYLFLVCKLTKCLCMLSFKKNTKWQKQLSNSKLLGRLSFNIFSTTYYQPHGRIGHSLCSYIVYNPVSDTSYGSKKG